MNFKLWESTFDDLFGSAVEAFPNTTMRQHATDPIRVAGFKWTPFPGVKTFLLKAVATNEDRQYNTVMLFKNVVYRDGPGPGVVKLKISLNESRYIEKLTPDQHNVLVRCNCPDFYWRFNYYDHVDRSLWGNKRGLYEPVSDRGPINPKEMPGMCKHLMKMMYTMQESGLVK